MVSGKERLRLERQWNEMKERMDRQANSITRLAALNTHLYAGLLEIANEDVSAHDGGYADALRDCALKAQSFIDAAEALRLAGSGNPADQQDSTEEPHPKENTHADND